MAEEVRLEDVESGLAPATDGWFVVNVRARLGRRATHSAPPAFEGDDAPFADLGINLRVLSPGRSKLLYRAESKQGGFPRPRQ